MADINNVLIIGDLHAPFTNKEYLEFCQKQYYKFNCNQVVFIGDIADFHYSSFHPIEPEALGCDTEYEQVLTSLLPWQKAFPNAKVTYGNHDLIPMRKSKANGLSPRMLKGWNTLFNAPSTWEFAEKFIIDDVLYTHGTNAALARMTLSRISVVQGHLHSLQYVQWSQSEVNRLFAMQVGCGIDNDSYAFVYGKSFPKKPILGCGVVLDNGRLPIVVPMHVK